jgi:hypothetical protein
MATLVLETMEMQVGDVLEPMQRPASPWRVLVARMY